MDHPIDFDAADPSDEGEAPAVEPLGVRTRRQPAASMIHLLSSTPDSMDKKPPRSYAIREFKLAPLPPVADPHRAALLFLRRMRRAQYLDAYRVACMVFLAAVFAAGLATLSLRPDLLPGIAHRLSVAGCTIGLIVAYPVGELIGTMLATRGLRGPDEVEVADAIWRLLRTRDISMLEICCQVYPVTVEHWLGILRRGMDDASMVRSIADAEHSLQASAFRREARMQEDSAHLDV